MHNWRARRAALAACGLIGLGSQAHQNAVASIIASAAIAAETSQEYVSFSRRKEWYAGRDNGDLTYTNVLAGIDILSHEGLIEEQRALPNDHLGTGRQSRFKATPLLLDRLGDARFEDIVPASCLVMRDEDGRYMPLPRTEQARRMLRATEAVNEGLASLDVRVRPDADPEDWQFGRHHIKARKIKGGVETWGCVLPTSVPYVLRILGRGLMDCHGRLYGWWLGLPKVRRLDLLLDGQEVEEPDYEFIHMQLLYAMAGQVLIGDPYVTGAHPRTENKLVLNIAINASGGRAGAVSAVMNHKGWEGTREYTEAVYDAVTRRNAPIAQYLGSDAGIRLMGIDSRMAVEVLKGCRKAGIAALPVHDSFICPRGKRGQVEAIMQEVLDVTRIRISPSASKGSVQKVPHMAPVGPAAPAASPPVSAPVVTAPGPRPLRWDPDLRLEAMIAYQIGCARAEMAHDRRQGIFTSWTELETAARRIAKSVCADENATGIRAFPVNIVPDRPGGNKMPSPKGGRSRKVTPSRGKGRRPRVTLTEVRA
ncbi:hypothetical protein [Methylobacterium sp. WL19]|uniref:hypothetical protein n=1 Tax=Methylobacterium sp. WL19 TaxID=2603896 RepID=UPI0011CA6B7E|nr:hypothetical protein [Methylobacterium sp. WL19]TXN27415.1 hypothetical protein FV220_11340 [Methylobacterium sp. WL19]